MPKMHIDTSHRGLIFYLNFPNNPAKRFKYPQKSPSVLLRHTIGDPMSSTDFSTTEAKASYGIGLQMGQQVRGAFPGVGIDAVVAGIQDAFAGNESQISNDDLNAAFQEIQKIVEAENAEKAKEFAAEGEAFLAENAKRDEVTVLDSGLQYEVINEGSGDVPSADSTVRTHYAGTLVNGQEFDSSYKRG